MFFILRQSKVLSDMVRHAGLVMEGAKLFRRSLDAWQRLPESAKEMKRLEVEADQIVHIIGDEVERTFILPLDKEDIHEFIGSLDDIIDNLEEATNRMTIYHLGERHHALVAVSDLVVAAVEEIEKGVKLVRDRKFSSEALVQCFRRLHDLENQGDRLHRNFLAEGMGDFIPEHCHDLVALLKWKEIFQVLENTLDRCEDTATLFERFRIKYA